MVDTTLVVGTLGMVLLLVAFVLNLLGRMEERSLPYTALNFAGAALLMYYAYALDSIPFLVLEAVWTGSAGYEMVKIAR